MSADLERVPEAVDEVIKESSASLASKVANLILASYKARDPGFDPYVPIDDFLAGTEEQARAQVRDTAEAIVADFEGTEPRIQLAYDTDGSEVEDHADTASSP